MSLRHLYLDLSELPYGDVVLSSMRELPEVEDNNVMRTKFYSWYELMKTHNDDGEVYGFVRFDKNILIRIFHDDTEYKFYIYIGTFRYVLILKGDVMYLDGLGSVRRYKARSNLLSIIIQRHRKIKDPRTLIKFFDDLDRE